MFVRTARGELVPLASFERFWTAEDDGQSREHGRLSNGATEQLAAGEIERLAESGARPFPAAPDTFVLQEVLDEHDRLSLERVPVLGWVLSPLRGVLPITIEGINHGLQDTLPVLMPTGEVVVASDCTYANQDCYFAELRAASEGS